MYKPDKELLVLHPPCYNHIPAASSASNNWSMHWLKYWIQILHPDSKNIYGAVWTPWLSSFFRKLLELESRKVWFLQVLS